MFSTALGKEYQYDLTSSGFRKAFEFLRRDDLAELPVGWIGLGDGVRASVQRYTSLDDDEAYFETHEKFFDVQYVIEGEEFCGICSRTGLVVKTPYDEKEDIAFYDDPELSGKVLLKAGDFIVLTPNDAHKPRLAAGKKMEIKKIVVKVPVI